MNYPLSMEETEQIKGPLPVHSTHSLPSEVPRIFSTPDPEDFDSISKKIQPEQPIALPQLADRPLKKNSSLIFGSSAFVIALDYQTPASDLFTSMVQKSEAYQLRSEFAFLQVLNAESKWVSLLLIQTANFNHLKLAYPQPNEILDANIQIQLAALHQKFSEIMTFQDSQIEILQSLNDVKSQLAVSLGKYIDDIPQAQYVLSKQLASGNLENKTISISKTKAVSRYGLPRMSMMGGMQRSSSHLFKGLSITDGLSNLLPESSSTPPVAATPVMAKNFSKVPKEVVDANLPKPELMRLSAVYELIETEIDYGKDLTVMIEYHKRKLIESKLLTEEDVQAVFSNTEDLYAANQALCVAMRARRDSNMFISTIGDILADGAQVCFVFISVTDGLHCLRVKLSCSYENHQRIAIFF